MVLMEPSREFQTSWSCLHCGFAADYFQSRSPILERTMRDQRRSTQASSSSQDFTSFLQCDERDVFDGYCFHPLPNRTVDQIVDVSISQRRIRCPDIAGLVSTHPLHRETPRVGYGPLYLGSHFLHSTRPAEPCPCFFNNEVDFQLLQFRDPQSPLDIR